MAKINLSDLLGGSIAKINANFTLIKNALNDKVLWRENPSGEPNQMLSPLDMNSKRILNLPAPASDFEPLRRIDGGSTGALASAVAAAITAAEAAQSAASSIANVGNANGSSFVGFLQSGVGSVVRTVESKLKGQLNVMDFGPDGTGVGDSTDAVKNAINALGIRGSGKLSNDGGKIFKITSTIDFSVLGASHTPFEIDFGGAIFVWAGDPASTVPMFKGYNNKSVKVKNFILLGSTNGTRSSVNGIFLDSLQPAGVDLCSFEQYRIAYCDTGIILGSTAAAQNRVSDSQIGYGVIENCRVGVSIRSTDVDSLIIGPCIIISTCVKDIEILRGGFIKIYDVTGYNSDAFITIEGPTESILIENCQSEKGELAGSSFVYRKNYTNARTGPITILNCVADDRIWMDYNPSVGSDAQVLNIIGGIFTDLSVDAPDTTVNLIGATHVASGLFTLNGANTKCFNFGSKLFGNRIDYVNGFRQAIYGDFNENYAIGRAPGLFGATGRSVMAIDGPSGGLFGLAVNGDPVGYLAASAGKMEVGAVGVYEVDLTAGIGPIARVRNNGAFKLIPRSSPPLAPQEGDTYYNSGNKKHYGYDGTTWNAFY